MPKFWFLPLNSDSMRNFDFRDRFWGLDSEICFPKCSKHIFNYFLWLSHRVRFWFIGVEVLGNSEALPNKTYHTCRVGCVRLGVVKSIWINVWVRACFWNCARVAKSAPRALKSAPSASKSALKRRCRRADVFSSNSSAPAAPVTKAGASAGWGL